MKSLEEPIFQLSSEPIAIIDPEGAIVRANDAWMSALGHSPDALRRRHVAELATPTEAEQVRGWVARVAGAGEPIGLRTVLRTGEGRPVFVHLRGAAAERPGHAYLLVRSAGPSVAAQLAALFEVTCESVSFLDDQTRIVSTNRETPGIPTEQVLGLPASRFVVPDQVEMIEGQFARALAGELCSHRATVPRLDGGGDLTFETRVGPVREEGRVVGVAVASRDITLQLEAEAARLRAEQQTREYLIQLERSNRELERFASVASHDLQEPLRKIQAFSDRLRQKYEDQLPEPGRDYLTRMQDAARRMQDLINDLLMYSRLTTKEQRLVTVDLNKILASVLSDLEVRIEEHAARVEYGPLPTVEADPLHMRQLLQNLISNALKFCRTDAPPRVEIRASALPHAGRGAPRWAISVKDDGIGIDPRYHDRIFGIFERLHSRGKYEGTGVGLAVCKKICEQLDGSLRVESDGLRGSTFTAELPVRQEKKQVHP